MTISDAYRVITTGRILSGFDQDEVRKNLVSVLRLQPAQAEQFFEKPRVVKKDVSWASADKLCNQLAQLGVSAEIQNPAPTAAHQADESKPARREEPALELVQDEGDASSKQGTVECPNCQHMQAKSEQCVSCGIWFHKFESSAPVSPPASAPKAIPVAAMQADNSTVASSDVTSEPGALNPAAIAAAVVAALIGAWIWRFVAVTFEYEFALIAWGIGGGVGFAAASAGSRGMQAGILCAILVFGSIVLGKYWAYSAFVDQFQEVLSETMEFDDEMSGYFEAEMEDARVLVNGSGGEIFIRRFMVDRGYTFESDPASISDAELAEFREYVEPALREMAQSPPNFEEWQANSVDSLDEISLWAMMREDFGILDILFMFLGIGTAFRIGSQWD
ncbi:MAG: hypothetical protein K0U72_13470 [Gammaproteobacteria bacterium]|nr:hypothetical protein [Gammaproteobacteria bacterium]